MPARLLDADADLHVQVDPSAGHASDDRTASACAEPFRGAHRTSAPGVVERSRLPRIGVNAPVMKLGRDADGTVQVPRLAAHNLAGWYRYGPSPGQRGPAVILGHVGASRARA
jgi:hypothetical protein